MFKDIAELLKALLPFGAYWKGRKDEKNAVVRRIYDVRRIFDRVLSKSNKRG